MRRCAFYVTNKQGYQLSRYSAMSLAMSQGAPFDIIIFCHGFQANDQQETKTAITATGHNLYYREISDSTAESIKTKAHVPNTAYLKIIAAATLKDDYNYAVYVDNDILFFADLEIDKIDFKDKPIAAVIDIAEYSEITDSTFHATCKETGVSPDYFNSGLVIFNNNVWKSSEFYSRYIDLAKAHQGFCHYKKNCRTNDQCVLNLLFENQWQSLPLTFNMQGCAKHTDYWKNATARHYQGKDKFIPLTPWRNDTRDAQLVCEIEKRLNIEPQVWRNWYAAVGALNRARLFLKLKRAKSAILGIAKEGRHHIQPRTNSHPQRVAL